MKDLLKNIRELILSARKAVVHSVDLIQVLTNFEIGRRIVEHEQGGAKRAQYGEATLKQQATMLTDEFGKGFSLTNLQNMRKFYLSYSDRLPEKCQMPSSKLLLIEKDQTHSDLLLKSQTPSGKFAAPQNSETLFSKLNLEIRKYLESVIIVFA
jgi:hypothetical protein